MKKILCLLLLVPFSLAAQFLTVTNPPASVTLAWDHSPEPEVSGYFIYWGVGSGQYTNRQASAGKTNYLTIDNLPRGATYYFAATAFTETGLESDFSNEVNTFIKLPPSPPGGLSFTNVTVSVSVERASVPAGPWNLYALLSTEASAPGFFRSKVSITAPMESPKPMLVRPALRSPKDLLSLR